MSPALLRLVLFISCAHALVHVYELSLPSVEQLIAVDFAVDTDKTGLLNTYFRLPFGMFALLAGWMADRWGAKRMLLTYLFGCAAMACAAALTPGLPALFAIMFAMGTLASIYHPAGLALISHETSAVNRPRALGTHGIFGSAGISGAPFLAGAVLSLGATWRSYYFVLAIPAALLGGWFLVRLKEHRPTHPTDNPAISEDDVEARWASYFVIILFGTMVGLIYSGFHAFLPRYLDAAQLKFGSIPPEGVRNYLAGSVLVLGMLGQYVSGRLARPSKLEPMLAAVLAANAPFLLWLAFAQGGWRVVAAAGFVLVHFMNQPVYNSLIASYVPRSRRSICYGFGFMMTFGVGGLGAWFAGYVQSEKFSSEVGSDVVVFGTLAALALAASVAACLLWAWNRERQ